MSSLTPQFHQGLWKLSQKPSRYKASQQLSSNEKKQHLWRSIGLQSATVGELSAKGFWKKVKMENKQAGPGQVYVVVICGDFIRDRIEDKTLPQYDPVNASLTLSWYFTEILDEIPSPSSAKLQLRNDLATSIEYDLRRYRKHGGVQKIFAELEVSPAEVPDNDDDDTPPIDAAFVTSWKRLPHS